MRDEGWIPAYAGMTSFFPNSISLASRWIPAFAGMTAGNSEDEG